MPDSSGVVVDAKLRAFVEKGVSIVAASRTAENVPRASRVSGCKVFDDNRLHIYLPTPCSRQLVEAIVATGSIAVVFSEVESHKTVQLKGVDAQVCSVTDECRAHMEKYCDAFTEQLTAIGYSESVARALVCIDTLQVTGVEFTPVMMFDQTPGPHAGEPVMRK